MAGPVLHWYEKYSATGWYVAGSLAVASVAQYLGERTVLLADVVRVVLIALFALTSIKVVFSAWESRGSDLALMTMLSVPMYVGFAGEAISRNVTRFGLPPNSTLGLNLFLFALATWRFFVSTRIIRKDLPNHQKATPAP
jgi:hypothetical protein